MEMYMKANGKMIKHMEKESIIIMMAQATLDNGVKIFSRAMVFRNGLMHHHTKGNYY